MLKQLEALNGKLDRLILAIESTKQTAPASKEGLTEVVTSATKIKKGYPKKTTK